MDDQFANLPPARLQDLLEQFGAGQPRKDLLALRWRERGSGLFDALGNPRAAHRVGNVRELHAKGAAVAAAGFFRVGAAERGQLRMRRRREVAQRVQARFEVAPAAKQLEDALAFAPASGGLCFSLHFGHTVPLRAKRAP